MAKSRDEHDQDIAEAVGSILRGSHEHVLALARLALHAPVGAANAAATALLALGPVLPPMPEIVEDLVSVARGDKPRRVACAVRALGAAGDGLMDHPAAIDLLCMLAINPDKPIRKAAIGCLAAIGPRLGELPDAMATLEACRSAYRATAGRRPDPEAPRLLPANWPKDHPGVAVCIAAAAHHTQPYVRTRAARVLAPIANRWAAAPDIGEYLAAMLADPDWMECAARAFTLEGIVDRPASVAALVEHAASATEQRTYSLVLQLLAAPSTDATRAGAITARLHNKPGAASRLLATRRSDPGLAGADVSNAEAVLAAAGCGVDWPAGVAFSLVDLASTDDGLAPGACRALVEDINPRGWPHLTLDAVRTLAHPWAGARRPGLGLALDALWGQQGMADVVKKQLDRHPAAAAYLVAMGTEIPARRGIMPPHSVRNLRRLGTDWRESTAALHHLLRLAAFRSAHPWQRDGARAALETALTSSRMPFIIESLVITMAGNHLHKFAISPRPDQEECKDLDRQLAALHLLLHLDVGAELYPALAASAARYPAAVALATDVRKDPFGEPDERLAASQVEFAFRMARSPDEPPALQ